MEMMERRIRIGVLLERLLASLGDILKSLEMVDVEVK